MFKCTENSGDLPRIREIWHLCEVTDSDCEVWDDRGPGWGGGGVPMSHVEFKKWQCRMSLSLINRCLLSNVRNGNVACHYRFSPSCRVARAPCRMSNNYLRNGHVAVSNLVVQTHMIALFLFQQPSPRCQMTRTSLDSNAFNLTYNHFASFMCLFCYVSAPFLIYFLEYLMVLNIFKLLLNDLCHLAIFKHLDLNFLSVFLLLINMHCIIYIWL